jgi:beta-glucosidase-like glycosyl hydrolase
VLATMTTAVALLVSGSAEAEVAAMAPREKAEAVVVAGMPAGEGFGGVLVRQWNTEVRRPRGAIVFADQEGGTVRTFRALAPWRAASQYRSAAQALRAGRETAADLRRAGVHAAFAPVLDLPDGPLGSPGRSTASPSPAGSAAPLASSTSPASARRPSRPTRPASTASSATRTWRRFGPRSVPASPA